MEVLEKLPTKEDRRNYYIMTLMRQQGGIQQS
jgi:hypothetical protein